MVFLVLYTLVARHWTNAVRDSAERDAAAPATRAASTAPAAAAAHPTEPTPTTAPASAPTFHVHDHSVNRRPPCTSASQSRLILMSERVHSCSFKQLARSQQLDGANDSSSDDDDDADNKDDDDDDDDDDENKEGQEEVRAFNVI